MKILQKSILVFALSLLAISSASAPILDLTLGKLKAAKSLKCTFQSSVYADPERPWPTPMLGKDQNMVMHFDAISPEKGIARLIGNLAATDVVVGSNNVGVYFLEVAPSNVTLTFVFTSQSEPGLFKAAHSRNLAVLSKVAPQQIYGTCKVWE